MKTLMQLIMEAPVDPGDMPNFKYTKEDHAQMVNAIHTVSKDKDFYFIVQCLQKAWEKYPNDNVINGLNLIQGLMSYSVNDVEKLTTCVKRVLNGRERSDLPTPVRGIVQRMQKFLDLYKDRLKSSRTATPQDIKDKETKPQWMPKSDFSKVKSSQAPKAAPQNKEPFSWSKFAP